MANTIIPYNRNFYSFKSDIELKNGAGGSVFGQSIVTLEVHKRRDVSNLNSVPGYVVKMNHRIIIPNGTVQQPGPTSATAYLDYPAILFNQVDIKVNNSGKVRLIQIFPKTLNSAVSTSATTNDGTSKSTSVQNSSGSTNTNINTFGVGISAGFFGDVPMGSISLDYSHSWEDSTMKSQEKGSSSGSESGFGFGESMSIKDWSSYGYLDLGSASPRWIWGQSYPWDTVQNNYSSDGATISLPSFVIDRMLSGDLVLPPSQLSLFGTDFTMQATWIIDFPNGVSSDEELTINHITQSYTAGHQLNGKTLSVTLQSSSQAATASYTSGPVDLSSFSLNPINGAVTGSGAAIGFTATPFTFPPTTPASFFKILSPANNVQVMGTGFNASMVSDFSVKPTFTVTFKIADTSVDYSLLLMHWIGKTSGACKLTWTVNALNTSSIYVENVEGNTGQNNISSIELRNTDFTSINFHDYLVIGTNTVTIEIEPVDPKIACEYTLFALAVGQL